MATYYTYRLDGTQFNPLFVSHLTYGVVGATYAHTALSDSDNSTYLYGNGITSDFTTGSATWYLTVPDPSTLSMSGQYVQFYRLLGRVSASMSTSTSTAGLGLSLRTSGGTTLTTVGAIATYGSPVTVPSTSATVTSASRASTGIISVTTAAAHGRSVNDLILIDSSTTGGVGGVANAFLNNQTFRILTVPTTTTFTAQDIRGAQAASTANATNGNISVAYNIAGSTTAVQPTDTITGSGVISLIGSLTTGANVYASNTGSAQIREVYVEVVTTPLPTVTINDIDGDSVAPYTVTTTSNPILNWTRNQADGYNQTGYRVKVFSAATANPDTTTANLVFDSGNVSTASTTTGTATLTNLPNNTTLYAYVKVRTGQALDDGWSTWGSGVASSTITFTTAYTGPPVPSVTPTFNSSSNSMSLLLSAGSLTAPLTSQSLYVQRSDDNGVTWNNIRSGSGLVPAAGIIRTNLLSNPSFETNTTSWLTSGVANVLTQSATFALFGTNSLRSAPSASGTAGIYTNSSCVAGTTYTYSVYVRSSVARTVTPQLDWYTADSVFIRSTLGTASATSTSAWTRYTVTGTAPAGAASVNAALTIASVTNTDLHYLDGAILEASSTARAFFDGTFSNAAWTGTAHASTSNVTLRENLCTNPSFDSNTTGWIANGAGTAISRITTDGYVGSTCLKVTKAAVSNSGAYFNAAVTPNRTYTLSAYVKIPDGNESAPLTIEFDWLTSAPAFISSTSTTTTVSAGQGWVRLSVTGVAPSNAASANMYVFHSGTATANNLFYVDAVLVETTDIAMGYTDTNNSLLYSLTDYEFMYGTTVLYRIYSLGTGGGNTAGSLYNYGSVTVPTTTTSIIRAFNSTTQTAIATGFSILGSLGVEQDENVGIYTPLGRTTKLVVHGTIRGEDGAMTLFCPTSTVFEAVKNVINSQNLILVTDLTNEDKYFRVISRAWDRSTVGTNERYVIGIKYIQVPSGL